MRAPLLIAALTFAAPAFADDAALELHRNEGLVARTMTTILKAQWLYRSMDKDKNGTDDAAPDFKALAKHQKIPAELAKTGILHGYRFNMQRSKADPTKWMAIARPVEPKPGKRYFAISHTKELLHSLKFFKLQDDCTPTGTKLLDPLPGWSRKTTALGDLFKKVGLKLEQQKKTFRAFLAPSKEDMLVLTEIGFKPGMVQVETMVVQRSGKVTALKYLLSPGGYLFYASSRRGTLTDRKRAEPTWVVEAATTGFTVTHKGQPAKPLAASPRVLPPDVLCFLVPRLLALLEERITFKAPVITLGIKSKPAVHEGEATVKRTKHDDKSSEFTMRQAKVPDGVVEFEVKRPGVLRLRALKGRGEPLTVLERKKAMRLIRKFTAKGNERGSAKVAFAKAHLRTFKAALQMYQADMGRFPRLKPRPAGPDKSQAAVGLESDAAALYAALINKPTVATGGGQNTPYFTVRAASLVGIRRGKKVTPVTPYEWSKINDIEFQKTHGPTSKEPLVLLDPWGNPYHYREWASVRSSIKDALIKTPIERTVTVGGKAKTIKDFPHTPHGFDLWSNGPNGINEYGAPGSDDVVSWRP